MREIKVRSAVPVYLTGLTWLAYAAFLPLYRLLDLCAAALLSAVVYLVSSRFFKDVTVLAPDESIFGRTGDADKDAALAAGKEYLRRLEALSQSITDAGMAAEIGRLRETGRSIYEFISKNNVDIRQIKRFADYYFPTALKLIESYAELSPEITAAGSAAETRTRIEGIMGSVAAAFDKQLGVLYEDKTLDIVTDIEVLKSMLRAEGLSDAGTGGGAS